MLISNTILCVDIYIYIQLIYFYFKKALKQSSLTVLDLYGRRKKYLVLNHQGNSGRNARVRKEAKKNMKTSGVIQADLNLVLER